LVRLLSAFLFHFRLFHISYRRRRQERPLASAHRDRGGTTITAPSTTTSHPLPLSLPPAMGAGSESRVEEAVAAESPLRGRNRTPPRRTAAETVCTLCQS
jgi:hypothetical protein